MRYSNITQGFLTSPAPRPALRPLPAADMHRIARLGTQTPSVALSYLDYLQPLFGRHDLGAIRMHRGRVAQACAEALHASAYAYGEHIVLAGEPDLRTVAHEVAHVIQQRLGLVASPEGVDGGDDELEQQADYVASMILDGSEVESIWPSSSKRASQGRTAFVQRIIKWKQEGRCDAPSFDSPTGSDVRGVPSLPTAYADQIGSALRKLIKDYGWLDPVGDGFTEIVSIISKAFLSHCTPQSGSLNGCCQYHTFRHLYVTGLHERARSSFKLAPPRNWPRAAQIAESNDLWERIYAMVPPGPDGIVALVQGALGHIFDWRNAGALQGWMQAPVPPNGVPRAYVRGNWQCFDFAENFRYRVLGKSMVNVEDYFNARIFHETPTLPPAVSNLLTGDILVAGHKERHTVLVLYSPTAAGAPSSEEDLRNVIILSGADAFRGANGLGQDQVPNGSQVPPQNSPLRGLHVAQLMTWASFLNFVSAGNEWAKLGRPYLPIKVVGRRQRAPGGPWEVLSASP